MSQNFDDIELEDLLEWMESGKDTMPPEIVAYALMLERIWGMYRRNFDFPNQEAIINYLVQVDGYKRYQAVKLLKDALIHFSSENTLPKDVWRNLLADKMMKCFTASIKVAKTAKDFLDAAKILKEIRETLQLDVEDIMEMEEDLMKQVQILTTDITMFGEDRVSRNELAQMIDNLPDVPEKIKEAAKLEVDRFPFRFLKSNENPRNND